ncbi:MAG: c-type cytochrome [Betaproteobacteria bacterium]
MATAQAAAPDVPQSSAVMVLGERLYTEHCAACHGEHGRGVAGIYPALVGNPRAARDPSTNLIRIIQEGGFGPATEGHPRPFGMPPFGHVMQPHEVAAVATFVRRQWNGAGLSEVTPLQVIKQR